MAIFSRQRKPLRLEALEDRTLLAGIASLELSDDAWSSTFSVQASLDIIGDDEQAYHQISFTGSSEANLEIYASQLPEEVFGLKLDSFSSVRIVGESTIGVIDARNVETLDIRVSLYEGYGQASTLHTDHVSEIYIGGEVPDFLWIKGEEVTVNSPSGFTQEAFIAEVNELNLLTGGNSSDLYITLLAVDTETVITTDFQPLSSFVFGAATVLPEGDLILVDQNEYVDIDVLLQLLDALEQLDPRLLGLDQLKFEELKVFLKEMSGENLGDEAFTQQELLAMSMANAAAEAVLQTPNGISLAELSEVALSSGLVQLSAPDTQIEVTDIGSGIQTIDIIESSQQGVVSDGASIQDQLSDAVALGDAQVVEGLSQAAEGQLPATPPTGLLGILAYPQRAVDVLKSHVISRISDEFTPGERPGLIVDTRGPIKKSFDTHLTI